MSAKGPVFPVPFDERAMVEDLARLGQGGTEALAELGREIDRLGGYPVSGCWPAKQKAATARGSEAASRRTSRGRRGASRARSRSE
jgi:hypothetical protein